jgi:hypothetical protein
VCVVGISVYTGTSLFLMLGRCEWKLQLSDPNHTLKSVNVDDNCLVMLWFEDETGGTGVGSVCMMTSPELHSGSSGH